MRKHIFLAMLGCVALFATSASAIMSYQRWNQSITASRPGIITFMGGTVPDSLVNPVPTPSVEGTIPDSFQNTQWGDNYVFKAWGWVTAPATGDYQFHYYSDDYGMVYLSPDEDMMHAVEVAYVDGWTNVAQWTKYPAQHSAPIQLKKGNVYALMCFYQQGTGGNQMGVGWTGPGLSQDIAAPDFLGDAITNIPPTPTLAGGPSPINGETDIPRDAVLSWTTGKFAATHDVYMGTNLDDVTNAEKGSALLVSSQATTAFDPAGLLDFGQTYYWRIDEVNAAPDSFVYKGKIWSFTAETYGYAVRPTKATASSSLASTMGPDKTIDGSGMDLATDGHGVSASTMWLSKKQTTPPVWIQYEFDKVYKLHEMWVWNSNQAVEQAVGFGAQDVTVEYSTDGTTWTKLDGVPAFTQALGEEPYPHDTTVAFGGASAKFVKLTINSNWADTAKQAGLSEVRFFYVPVQAFKPSPANAGGDVAVGATLNWRPGREAVSHSLYISADANAVANETVASKAVTGHSFDLTSLNLDYGRTYYWKVNEVNDAAATKVWQGEVWSFTTIAYAVVDNFDSYDNVCNRIFFAWVDGFGYSATPDCSIAGASGNGTGSTVGNDSAPFAEKTVTRGGSSMPLRFDNTKSPFYSETQRTWSAGTNWTGGGVNTLVVYMRGDAPGFLETTPGTILMNGTGTDIWDASDQFRFVYKTLKGNGSIVAKVESVTTTNEWAKAGVMIRETVSGGSMHAITAVTPTVTHGVSFQYRNTADTATNQSTDVANTPIPQWVKLTRNGTSFTAQYSSDGKAWTDIVPTTAATITMANDVLIGLAVTSHAAGALCSAKFTNVSTTGGVSGSWQVAEVGTAQLGGNTPETFYVGVQDKAGKSMVISNPDASVISTGAWQEWQIPLSQFTGVNMGSIQKLTLGVGSPSAPRAGGSGKVYIDDIRLIRN